MSQKVLMGTEKEKLVGNEYFKRGFQRFLNILYSFSVYSSA